MNLKLRNKNVLITGSSSGIGLEMAKHFSVEGCNVVLNGRHDIDEKILKSLAHSGFAKGDVANEKEAHAVVKKALKLMGSLDIVICNVGSGKSVKPGQESFEEWQKSFLQNFYSTTCIVEGSLDALKSSKGVIICISSICGNETIPGAPVTYSVAKAALNAYIKGISRPLGEEGIRICGIAPGNILFDGSVWDKKLQENRYEVEAMLQKEVPLNTLGSPAEIASLAMFLASPQSNFTTGSIWTLDGGQVRSN